ncbi:MAG: arsenate reductase ArsC [Gemmatimonadaceae bacterium]
MTFAAERPQLRVLVLCTRNSARSQMGEALLQAEGAGRVHAASAGSAPGDGVHPLAVEALAELGIDWRGRPAQGIDAVANQKWDAVITVCDAARDACPILPGARLSAHWGLEDPAAIGGDHATQLDAFRSARDRLGAAVRAFVNVIDNAGTSLEEHALRAALNAGARELGQESPT